MKTPRHGRRSKAFTGKVVLVTGASSGIGRATALRLARQGARLVLVSRSEDVLEQVRAECAAAGAEALVAAADVGDARSVEAAFRVGTARFGRIDGVVHSAAVLAYGRFEDVPRDVFDAALHTTLTGTANVARCALTAFDGGGGSLVVLGSLLGKISTPYMSSYVTAKWGVHGLVRTLQIEARQTPGVDISLVWPGGVDTPVYLQAGTYLRRHGRPPPPVDPPEKVARVVVRALARPRRESSVGVANHLVVTGFQVFPGVFDRIVTPLMRAGGIGRHEVDDSPGNVLAPQRAGEAVHGRWGRHWLRPVAAVGAGAGALAIRHATGHTTGKD
ncbi:Short-chain dehydrogenase [Pedococcus dokdonensis]|uniref:Short-chain dehydrogenase n=1 Tax=Pedococcus dokdonensis TaxID=443156 RepID=A0A1H0M9H6_9MICO|nr:SDR family NAD(P)-dependent oxidoreductase [Pedococcus dokdonensis]SDO77109.1 Short-chain dehydrogenase [Pedococcus dokdonensis]